MNNLPALALQHISLLQQFSYLGIFIAVVLAGHFVPIPEDISLIFAGYISALGYANLWIMLVIGATAPVVADALLFYLSKVGSRFAPHPDKYKERKMFKWAMHYMHNHTILAVILMRFVTGFRFISPIVGAYINVPTKKYFLANFISACIYGPFFILLGYKFESQITRVVHTMKSVEHLILLVVAIVIVSALGVFLKTRYNIRNAKE
ncbi:DedA family protein [Candidatus Parcubacteria bacterium]|nr:DedA family protein [Candidatus Parcubacteria bacterium]